MSERIVAHLDMDAFYASVELLRYPQLRGLPVVVGGRRRIAGGSDPVDAAALQAMPRLREYSGRGVITTATYEARALGVHSGMGLMKAARLAPDALLLPSDFDRYRHYSRLFKEAVRALTPQVEDRGIDEIYIDLTEASAQRVPVNAAEPDAPYLARSLTLAPQAQAVPSPDAQWDAAHALATELQRAVREATGLSCSLGVTPNKLLSKIASELNKPGGITVLRQQEVAQRIWPLAARKINGIGPKAAAKLEALGIRSIGELAQADAQWLIAHFGRSYGSWLHEAAHGCDERPVVTFRDPKSISRETTFEHGLHPRSDRARLSTIFTELCARVADDLQRKGYAGKTIGVKLRFDDFTTVTRDHTLPAATQDAGAIRHAAGQCVKRIALARRIRLLGVRVGALVPAGEPRPPCSAADGYGAPRGTTAALF